MVDVVCKNCGAIFVVDQNIPEDMGCFCGNEEFEITEKKQVIV